MFSNPDWKTEICDGARQLIKLQDQLPVAERFVLTPTNTTYLEVLPSKLVLHKVTQEHLKPSVLAAGILALQVEPNTGIVKYSYPFNNSEDHQSHPLSLSRFCFFSTKDIAGLMLARCCEALGGNIPVMDLYGTIKPELTPANEKALQVVLFETRRLQSA